MLKINEEAFELSIKEACINKENNYQDGEPFGAVIVKDGKIIASAHNTVNKSMDATAHAEINAIRIASQMLKTSDLRGCILYASSEPCPMCLSAIIWANIKDVYFANTKEEANDIGFRDDIIYDYIKGKNKNLINMYHIENKEALKNFQEFKENDKKIMY